MNNRLVVEGKVVWVTGSSRGIGRGVVEHFARCGARVVVHARTDAALDEVATVVEACGAEVLRVAADVRDAGELEAAVAAIDARFGRLDGLVANVGGAAYGAIDDLSVERFRRQLDLNLTGAYAVVKASLPLLRAGRGSAVLVAATAAAAPSPSFSAYGAAKAGIAQLTPSLAAELGPEVRVNCISPGLIRTGGSMEAVFGGSEAAAIRAGAAMAVGRVGEPEDIAYACQYLISDAASFVSGTVLVVDGGPTEGPTQAILRAAAGV